MSQRSKAVEGRKAIDKQPTPLRQKLQSPRAIPPKPTSTGNTGKLHTAPSATSTFPTLPRANPIKPPHPRMLEPIAAGAKAMGIFKAAFAATGWTTLGATAGYVFWTRKTKIVDVPPTDYLFNSTFYARYNPNNAPVTQDLAVRRVPLTQIKPELLEKEGKLVESFCAGVWSGLGFAYQRRFLEKKYRADPVTQDHLWDTKDLQSNTYEIGTKITDHFEVISKTPSSIIVRCGDSPRIQDVRASDGLFEMTAEVKKDEGVAEFGLKSIFYNGLAQPDKESKVPQQGPMSTWIQWLHQQYDKVLMETAISNVSK